MIMMCIILVYIIKSKLYIYNIKMNLITGDSHSTAIVFNNSIHVLCSGVALKD